MSAPEIRDPTLDYRRLFEVAPVGVLFIDGEGHVLECNEAAERMLGWSRDELRGRHLRTISHPGELEEGLRLLEEMRAGLRDAIEFDKRYLRKDGSAFWAHLTSSCIRDEHGAIRYLVSVIQDIDDRRRAEAALREGEERFRTLVEQSLAGIYILKGNRFRYANPRFAEVFGLAWPVDDVRVEALVHAEDLGRVQEMIRRLETGDTDTGRYAFRGRRHDDTVIHVEVHGARATMDGEPVVVGLLMDVTDRHQAEQALAMAKHQYETLLDTIPDPAWLKDGDSRLLACNDALARLLGRPREEIRGLAPDALLPPDVAERTTRDDRRAIAAGGPFAVEEVMAGPDGEERLYETIKSPFRDHRGAWAGTAGIARDITDRKASEASLRLLSAAVEQSAAGIIVTDTTGTIIYVNRRFCESTGYAREEVVGRNPNVLKSGHHDEAFYREMWSTISAGREWRGEIHNRRKDGSLLRELAAISPIHDADGRITHFLAVKDDVTELRALEQRLLQSQKLEAIGQLAGGIAHDFNNMLTAISGFGDLLRPELEPGSRASEYLDQITRAAARSSRLTSQLLAFSRRQILKPHRLDLNEVARDMAPMLGPLIGERVRLTLTLDEDPAPRVLADRIQIEQVLLNLVLNARDAMPDGGTLEIATRCLAGRGALDDRVELVVSDSGGGIPAEALDHIFEPFYTTKPPGQGTGLGLATVYGIVRQSGGEIEVQSEPDQGTRFRIRFPAAPADAEAMTTPVPEAGPLEPAADQGATILVVEDEPPVRQLVSKVLERGGYRVLQAATGEDALALPEVESIDLLLTDVVMPGMSGRELASALRTMRPELPVLYMSGYTQDEVLRHGIEAGEVSLLEKPFSPADLLATVRSTLG